MQRTNFSVPTPNFSSGQSVPLAMCNLTYWLPKALFMFKFHFSYLGLWLTTLNLLQKSQLSHKKLRSKFKASLPSNPKQTNKHTKPLLQNEIFHACDSPGMPGWDNSALMNGAILTGKDVNQAFGALLTYCFCNQADSCTVNSCWLHKFTFVTSVLTGSLKVHRVAQLSQIHLHKWGCTQQSLTLRYPGEKNIFKRFPNVPN